MTHLVLNGMIGLMLGIALHLCRVDRADTVREALAFRRPNVAKALTWAMGSLASLTALLMWLAVIDVDDVPVLPLSGRVLLGGVVAGASLGLAGFTPETAFAGVGGGRFTESLCAVMGCGAAWFLAPRLEGLLRLADGWFEPVRATVFRVTLDEPFLLPGSFLAQGGVGLALCLLALLLPREKPAPAPVPPAPPAEPPAEPVSIEPETVQEETVVVTLPGEEPVVVDTEEQAQGTDPPECSANEEEASAPEEPSSEET